MIAAFLRNLMKHKYTTSQYKRRAVSIQYESWRYQVSNREHSFSDTEARTNPSLSDLATIALHLLHRRLSICP